MGAVLLFVAVRMQDSGTGPKGQSFWTASLLSIGDSSSHLNVASAPPNAGIKLEHACASSQPASYGEVSQELAELCR